MIPNYHPEFAGHFPIDHDGQRTRDDDDHHPNQNKLFFMKSQDLASSSSTSPSFFDPIQEQEACYYRESHQLHHQQQAKKYVPQGESREMSRISSTDHSGLKLSISWKKEDRKDGNSGENRSVKWMSSKMRLMKKMMNPDSSTSAVAGGHGGDSMPISNSSSVQPKIEDHNHHQRQKQLSSYSSLESNTSSDKSYTATAAAVRVCADCNTTKTPLWRSGPQGPKSLCNACGIRQRKARRAMAAAGANGIISGTSSKKSSTGTTATSSNKTQQKSKIITCNSPANNSNLPFKKRCKLVGGSTSSSSPNQQGGKSKNKKLCIEDLTIILSQNSAVHQRVFPQDEKEAAILLMALSYGLVHG